MSPMTHFAAAILGSVAGASEGQPSIDLWVLGSVVTNFVLFAVILVHYLRGPVARALVARRSNMEEALKEARAKQEEAAERLKEFQYKLEHLEEEVARIVRSYEAEAEAERARLKEDTDRAIQRLTREAEFTISQEVRAAELSIREAAVKTTLELAEKMIRDKITEADHRRLADQYVRTLAEKPPSA